MRILRNIEEITPDLNGGMVTIGNFDGIHVAHQKIINRMVREARESGRKGIVVTFEPHPQHVLHPEKVPFYLITSLAEKLSILESMGVDAVLLIHFTREFSRTSAEEFVKDIIWGKLHPLKVLIGHDYTFGKGKEGKPEYFKSLGSRLGFEVEITEAVVMEGGIVSSTRIRHAIQAGDMRLAARLLGRPYCMRGTVIKGHRRGGLLGFPTANLKTEKELLPKPGVYAVFVQMGSECHEAVLNIGFNPTFSNEKLSVETHILDFNQNIYGKGIKISFIERLRDEKKFNSIERLSEQIAQDIEKARKILKRT